MIKKIDNSQVDAVIVLANLMDERGILNTDSYARACLAAELFIETQARYLITCGWAYRGDCDLPISTALKSCIISNYEINPCSILEEDHSRDTVGDAYFTKVNFAVNYRLKNLIVVTSAYHVRRAEKIFRFIYGSEFIINVAGAKTRKNSKIFKHELHSLEVFQNTFKGVLAGDDSQVYSVLRERHPYYNGITYPII